MQDDQINLNEPQVRNSLFIKQVDVKDFLTYRDMQGIAVEGAMLSPHLNILVGKNGFGKSSLLKAISFVLSESQMTLSKAEKRSYLNNLALQESGSRQRRAEAHTYWVEVTLDNSQRRFPIDSQEVKIKRQYNIATDAENHFLNGNHISQKDLVALLDSANIQTQF